MNGSLKLVKVIDHQCVIFGRFKLHHGVRQTSAAVESIIVTVGSALRGNS